MADGSFYITHPLDAKLLELKIEYETASAERRMQIEIEAARIRESGKKGVEWSVSSDRSLEYYMIDTDVTEKLNELMSSVEEEYRGWGGLSARRANDPIRYLYFAYLVRPGGIYDLKSKQEWQGRAHFMYEDKIIWFDDPGNILYGYLGKVMGFSDLILCAAGGAVQIIKGTSSWKFFDSFFDDPRDQISIRLGIDKYRNRKRKPEVLP